jgi:hypothetical protein
MNTSSCSIAKEPVSPPVAEKRENLDSRLARGRRKASTADADAAHSDGAVKVRGGRLTPDSFTRGHDIERYTHEIARRCVKNLRSSCRWQTNTRERKFVILRAPWALTRNCAGLRRNRISAAIVRALPTG